MTLSRQSVIKRCVFGVAVALILGLAVLSGLTVDKTFAQNTDPVVTETGTEPPNPTATPTTGITPTSEPVPIPEPVTVILFGTGLAALSAAAVRRKKQE